MSTWQKRLLAWRLYRCGQGRTQGEIAACLCVSRRTVNRWIGQANQTIRTIVEACGEDSETPCRLLERLLR